jgi:hypothetical protein
VIGGSVEEWRLSAGAHQSIRRDPEVGAQELKWRLIVDLSSPRGKSINDGISKELYSVSYLSIDEVASWVVRAGKCALLAKFDLKSAYRQVPVHPDDRKLLGMEWEGQIYVDTTLPFGLRSAPIIFSAVADALAYMIRQKIRD